MEQVNYNIRDPHIEELLKKIALVISDQMPERWGFNLMLFEYGPKGSLFYISSAQREDIIKVMKEFISRNEH